MQRYLMISFCLVFLGIIFGTQQADAAFTINTVQYNNDDAIDIVFVADGFTLAEQSVFDTRVTQSIGHIFDNPPFNTQQSNFNIYSIPTVSNESGISVLGGTTVDSKFGSYLNRDNLARYTGLSETSRAELRNELKKFFKKKIYVVMILNTGTYGGSGDLNSMNRFISLEQVTLDNEFNIFRELVIHEFGHSFADLADEYSAGCTDADRPAYWDHDLFDKKNVTFDNISDRKWDALVGVPQYFLGANYCTNEWYRSSNSDLMRSLTSGNIHNELGQILIQNRINEDLIYNQKVVSYQSDGVVNIPSQTDRNIRIHADESTLSTNLQCDNLYIAEDSVLQVKSGVSINCNSITALGTINYLTATPPKRIGYYVYGCKDRKATNYTRFVRHRQSMCTYNKLRQSHLVTHEGDFVTEI